MKRVKAELTKTHPDKVEAFEKGAGAYAKKVVADFKNYDFVSFPLFRRLHLKSSLVHWRKHER